MENHYFDTLFSDPNMIGHCIALSLSDLSIWCYACENYIKHDKLKQTSKVAEIGKILYICTLCIYDVTLTYSILISKISK